MVTFPDFVRIIGGTGSAACGKTWFFLRLLVAAGLIPGEWLWDIQAGLIPAQGLFECSGSIVPLAEMFRKYLWNYIFVENRETKGIPLLEDPRRLLPELLVQTPVWFGQVSDGIVPSVPPEAFTDGFKLLEQRDLRTADTLLMALRHALKLVIYNRDRYEPAITVETKSTVLNRPLLTAINMLVSQLVCQWLRQHEGLDIANIWPHIELLKAERFCNLNPWAKGVFVNGLRMPGDDDEIRRLRGLVFERQFTGAVTVQSHLALATEQPGNVVADWIVRGPADVDRAKGIDDLLLVAVHVWQLIIADLLKPRPGDVPQVLLTQDLLACTGNHHHGCLATAA